MDTIETESAAVEDSGPRRLKVRIATAGIEFPGDEPVAAGGTGTGPGPYDLLSAALAECTTLTLRLYADQKGWPLAGIRVAVSHARVAGETPPDQFTRVIRLTGPLDEAQTTRLLQIAERCPVHRTLTTGARITTTADGG